MTPPSERQADSLKLNYAPDLAICTFDLESDLYVDAASVSPEPAVGSIKGCRESSGVGHFLSSFTVAGELTGRTVRVKV